MISQGTRTALRICGSVSHRSRSGLCRLQTLSHRHKTILAAVDGTKYGYLALEEAFTMSNAGDEIIGYHIPLDSYQFAYEHLVFQSGRPLSQSQRTEYEQKKQQFVDSIDAEVTAIKSKRLNPDVEFRFVVGTD